MVIYLNYHHVIDWRSIDLDNNAPLTEAIFYILLSVRTPNHGYGIIQDVSKMTDGRVTLGPGTLYGAINSMLSKGWVRLYSEDTESRKKKEYLLTGIGKQVFVNEVKRLSELIRNAELMNDKEGNIC